MPRNDLFPSPTVFTGSWADYFILTVVGLLAVLTMVFFREHDKHDPDVHSPRLAWLRGGMFFCGCFIVSWLSGVFGELTAAPLATPAQLGNPRWVGLTVLCACLLCWGYFYWWPKGTVTHGRPAHPLASGLFGLLWGSSTAQLQLSLFALIEEFQLGRATTGIAVFALFAAFNLGFQMCWWDIRVSPPHNVRAWNTRKVLLAHSPFLICTLAYFALFGNAALYVLFQALALAAAGIAMRFPPFWLPDGTTKVSRETALGI